MVLSPTSPAFWGSSGHTVSIDLDGSTEEIRTTANTAFDSGNFSILLIVKNEDLAQASQRLFTIEPSGATTNRITVAKPTAANAELEIGMIGNNGSVAVDDFFAGVFVQDTWVHLLFTWDNAGLPASALNCYINGVLTAPTSHGFGGGDGISAVNRLIIFGANKAGANFWDGRLYQAAYWGNGRILSAAAITSLYNLGKPSQVDLNNAFGSYSAAMAADLDFWWQFGRDSGDIAKNYAASPPSTPTYTYTNVDSSDIVADYPG